MLGRRSTLSEVCSALLQVSEGDAFSYEEARAFGAPMEDVGPVIFRGTEKRVLAVMALSGWTPDEVNAELLDRGLTEKYVYFRLHDVGEMLDLAKYERLPYGGADPGIALRDRVTGEVLI